MTFRLVGDWAKAAKITETMADRFKKAAEQAVMKEAHLLRGHMVRNITTGGQHAGKPFAPLSENTLIIRKFKGFGGGKPLMVTGALRGSITVVKVGSAVFVGARRKTGKGVNLAELHEYGSKTYSIPMTPKMRRFLAAAFRAAGKPFGKGGGGGGAVVIRIPARPFIGPVIDKFAKPADVRKRFWAHVSNAMGGDLGR